MAVKGDDSKEEATYSVVEVAKILKQYEDIYCHQARHLISQDVMAKFYRLFPEAKSLSWSSLLDYFSNKFDQNTGTNELDKQLPNLSKYVAAMKRISYNPPCSNHVYSGFPDDLFTGVKEKKRKQVCYFAKYIDQRAKSANVRTIVDVGCGKGILARALYHLGYVVVGIDGNEKFIEQAKKLAANQRNSAQHFCHAMIDNKNQISDILEGLNITGGFILISNHGCGNLQKTILQSFVEFPSRQCNTLISLPCCFHKRVFSGHNEWAMSKTVREGFEKEKVNVDVAGLRLAGDLGFERFADASFEATLRHGEAMYRRAFATVSEKEAESDEINKVLVENTKISEDDLNDTLKYSIAQSFLQNALETCVLADHVYFLRDCGYKAGIEAIWPKDRQISPRNCAVVCTKLQQSELLDMDDDTVEGHELDCRRYSL